jgi:glutathione S-transferase
LVADKPATSARHFTLLDRHLGERDFTLGDTLSSADIPIGTCLYRYFNLEIDRPAVPNVTAWYRRLQERPAYRRHVMVPFDELYGRLEA